MNSTSGAASGWAKALGLYEKHWNFGKPMIIIGKLLENIGIIGKPVVFQ